MNPFVNPFILGCILYFALLITVSTVFNKHLSGFLDFFLGGKHLPMWMITVSVLSAWLGATSTMGSMTYAFTEGLSACWLMAIPTITAMLLNGFVLAKAIRQSELTSIPEAVLQTYGPVASLAYALVIYMAVTTLIGSQLVACGGLFEHLLGIPMQQSIPWVYFGVIIYSVIGGFRAVVLTDLIQFVVLMLGITIVMQFVLSLPALPHQVIQPLIPTAKAFESIWITRLPEHVVMMLTFTLSWSIAPELWQRLAALPSVKDAQKMVIYASLVFVVFFTAVILIGYWSQGRVDPIAVAQSKNLLAVLLGNMPNGLSTTVIMVAIMAAISSVIDSTLNIGCMTIARDIMGRFVLRTMTPDQELVLSRFATIVVGLPAMAIALFYRDLVKIMWVSADIYASAAFIPVMGLFYCKRGQNPLSGALAICFGLVPVLLQFFGHDLHCFILPSWWPGAPYTTLLGIFCCAVGYGFGVWLHQKR